MFPVLLTSLLAALDYFLRTLSAFKALGEVSVTFRAECQSRTLDNWGVYQRSWEALFQTAIDALLLVSHVVAQMDSHDTWLGIQDRQLADLIGNLFGVSDRFAIVVRNYESAKRSFDEANARFLADRSEKNFRLKEAADNSRGTWYRELHTAFSAYEEVLKRVDANRAKLIVESKRTD